MPDGIWTVYSIYTPIHVNSVPSGYLGTIVPRYPLGTEFTAQNIVYISWQLQQPWAYPSVWLYCLTAYYYWTMCDICWICCRWEQLHHLGMPYGYVTHNIWIDAGKLFIKSYFSRRCRPKHVVSYSCPTIDSGQNVNASIWIICLLRLIPKMTILSVATASILTAKELFSK